MSKKPAIKPLSKKRKKQLARWTDSLLKHFVTPEGDEWLTRAIALHERIHGRQKKEVLELTPREEKALRFIKREQKWGQFPSVREVAKAIGARSSRTGARVVNCLKEKALI